MDTTPKDKYNLVYIAFYLMGVGVLMPWNLFINVQEYWNYKFRDVKSGFEDIDDNHLRMDVHPNISSLYMQNDTFRDTQRLFMDDIAAFTPLQLRWNSYLSNANMAPKLGILILNVYYGHKIPIRPKFLISLAIVALCFVVTGVMSKVNTDGFQNGFLGLTLVTVVLISSFSGICQGALSALATHFPPEYMGAVGQGQIGAGIITSILDIINVASVQSNKNSSPADSAFYCFLAASLFIFLNIVALILMINSRYYKYCMSYETRIETDSGVVSETSSLKSSPPTPLYTNEPACEAVQILLHEPEPDYGATHSHDGFRIEDESQELLSTNAETHLLRRPSLNVMRRMSQDVMRRMSQCIIKTIPTPTWQILSKIWIWNLTMFLTYVICLSVFPSITALVESTYSNKGYVWNDEYFTPVGCFLLFNVGSYFGIVLSSFCKWPDASRSGSIILLNFSIARLVFIPFFIFCNIEPFNRKVTNVYINSDVAFLLMMAVLSISHGYITNTVMMFGPKAMERQEDQSRAASILVFFLVLGLTVGALLSAPLLQLI